MKSISVIVPLYNERDSLGALLDEIEEALVPLHLTYEIVCVDDGSRDGSFEHLRSLQENHPELVVIRLRRNFGKSAALSAGFEMASGDVVVTLDADLQDKPSEIAKLLDKLNEGNDLVSGWKIKRQDPLSKRWPSRVFNLVTSLLTGVPLHDINCGFKAYRRQVIEEIRVYGEMHRYIPVLASYLGFRVAEVPVEHRARRFGKSKYGVGRFAGGFFDLLTVILLTRYNRKPLHIFGFLGLILLGTGLGIELYLTIGWFMGQYIEDRPLFMLGVLLLIVGLQSIFFGLLAEMIAYSSRREDDYAVETVLRARGEQLKEQVRFDALPR